MPAPRVIHVCGRMKVGGITRFVESMVALNASSASRHDLLLTFADGPEPRPGDFSIHRLDLGRRGVIRCAREARRIYREYDGVMIHGAHPIAVLPLIGLRRRVFVFQHGMSVSSGPRWIRAVKKIWFSVLPWLFDAQTVCSTKHALEKSRALGIRIDRRRVRIVPFGTDVPRSGPVTAALRDAPLTIGMAGRLDAQKRQHLILESLEGYAGRPLRLLVAGDGPQRPMLEQLASRVRGERVEVTFLGNVGDMMPFYDQLDLLALPSAGESFGLVAVEALMRSVPVAVLPDVGGCLALVRPDETGFVVSGGAEGFRRLWNTLDARPDVLVRLRGRIAALDLSEFTIARTRAALDRLTAPDGAAASPLAIVA